MEIFILSYNISETNDYLSIAIFNTRYCKCSGAISAYSYVVNKKTKKLMTKEEILGLFNVICCCTDISKYGETY